MPSDLTTALAIWGAVVATILLFKDIILAFNELRKGRPSIRVTCNLSMDTSSRSSLIEIEAVNVGERPVEVRAAGFDLSNKMPLLVSPHGEVGGSVHPSALPKKLDVGETVAVRFFYIRLKQELEHQRESRNATLVAAYVTDAEGHKYKTLRLPGILEWAISPRRLWWSRLFRRPPKWWPKRWST